jgi:acetylornithine deacetylase
VSPRAVIIGEPTSMRVVNAHKGGYNYTTRIVGQEAHSSLTHHGVNAIALASDLIAHLLDYANKLGRRADPDNGFDPPYSTLSIGTIHGGTASNIVAKECEFEWDWRPIPEDPFEGPRESLDAYVESLLPKLREIAPKASIQTVCDSGHVPLMPEEDSSAEKLVMALAETNQTFKVAYGTEGWVYQEQNMPVVVFGPGSIEQAHKPDEFIDLEQVDACTDFLRKLIARFSGNQKT